MKNLFPTGKMSPPRGVCNCGYSCSREVLESSNVNIHHSHPTVDSREGNLAIFFLMTDKCECVKYYSGTEDRLVRVSAARIKYKKCETIHFVSVDMLNQYFEQLYSSNQGQ